GGEACVAGGLAAPVGADLARSTLDVARPAVVRVAAPGHALQIVAAARVGRADGQAGEVALVALWALDAAAAAVFRVGGDAHAALAAVLAALVADDDDVVHVLRHVHVGRHVVGASVGILIGIDFGVRVGEAR